MGTVRSALPIHIAPMISVTVDVISSVETDKSTSFTNICEGNAAAPHVANRIRQLYKCPTCEATDGFKKAKEDGGELKVLSDDEVAALRDPGELKEGVTLTFHPKDEVDERAVNGDKVYFCKPSKGQAKAYALLLHGLKTNPTTAFCAVAAVKGKPAMWTLGTFGDVITMQKVSWPEDLVDRPVIDTTVEELYVPFLQQVIDNTRKAFDPSTFRDSQRQRVAELLASKTGVESVPLQPLPDSKALPDNVDMGLLAALQAAAQATAPAPAEPAKPKRAPRKRVPKAAVSA